jgi:hypothetical protein
MRDDWDDDSDEEWPDDDDSAETVPCPSCGADIYEEAEQCPECGEYVVRDNSVLGGKPRWYIVLALLGILAVVAVLSGLIGSF